jgi:acyl-CoA synthetase (AMP-forming)/AMP-acid ligase II
VTGRLKDLIIIRGRNHYPQDLEHSVEEASSLIRAGSVAAFAVDIDDRERVVVVAEIERGKREPADLAVAFDAIRSTIARDHEVAVEAIVLVRPNSISKTSSTSKVGNLSDLRPLVSSLGTSDDLMKRRLTASSKILFRHTL